jgi:amphi-Trp domain-containing protein
MAKPERDVEKEIDRARFVETLRRLADALEANEPFRIQVAQKRFTIPAGATLQIEHEIDDESEELALELRWRS